LNSVRITDQRTADNGPLKRIGPWVKDSLLMGDLAYYDFGLFHRIDQQDGYFLSRMKQGANPLIVASNQSHRGRSIDLVGKKLQDVLERLARETIDVTVELEVKFNKYRGTRSTRMRRSRMVGIRDDESRDYRLYFTNVDGEQMTPEQIADERGHTPPDVFELLAAQAADPNRSRARAHDIPDELPPANPERRN